MLYFFRLNNFSVAQGCMVINYFTESHNKKKGNTNFTTQTKMVDNVTKPKDQKKPCCALTTICCRIYILSLYKNKFKMAEAGVRYPLIYSC